ncbi:hypothetical protein GDO81_024879 [Engystomops pustulosus]|uniref:Uncharacterized protein n=1 Tax=Engystomops pustulosus TaxID=76066 RepID=A0AAV6YPX9_ENGPU|nr:hypothetical protein GDO81_024879 [Engystomops pustulosus]
MYRCPPRVRPPDNQHLWSHAKLWCHWDHPHAGPFVPMGCAIWTRWVISMAPLL